jgi:cellulose synthase/poly-beta-1,6-N-acetylglucosamine synthase-like glycosyltransferase
LVRPKLGEAIAFRNIIISLPEDLAVDEAYIESVFTKRGYKLVYCPDAVIYNKAPETLMDFLKQRRRIETGHFYLRKKYGYHASTDFFLFKLKALLSILFVKRPGYFIPRLPYVVILYFLLKYARMLAYYNVFVARENHCVWDEVASTKDLSERY